MTLLSQRCYSCHNSQKKKGGLSFATRAAALKGSEDGAVLVPGDAAHSVMITALAADADPHMPPEKQLGDSQIALLRSWIDSGAARTQVGRQIKSPWGEKFIVDGSLHAPAGLTPTVRTIWIVDASDKRPRLVTAYPRKERP
jgi:cytochrome c551/c552